MGVPTLWEPRIPSGRGRVAGAGAALPGRTLVVQASRRTREGRHHLLHHAPPRRVGDRSVPEGRRDAAHVSVRPAAALALERAAGPIRHGRIRCRVGRAGLHGRQSRDHQADRGLRSLRDPGGETACGRNDPRLRRKRCPPHHVPLATAPLGGGFTLVSSLVRAVRATLRATAAGGSSCLEGRGRLPAGLAPRRRAQKPDLTWRARFRPGRQRTGCYRGDRLRRPNTAVSGAHWRATAARKPAWRQPTFGCTHEASGSRHQTGPPCATELSRGRPLDEPLNGTQGRRRAFSVADDRGRQSSSRAPPAKRPRPGL